MKPVIRSIRISEDMLELIERQAGRTFTEKWENLVTRCVWELAKKEEQLAGIQRRIDREYQRLRELERATEQLCLLEKDLHNAKYYFGIVERRAKAIADSTGET